MYSKSTTREITKFLSLENSISSLICEIKTIFDWICFEKNISSPWQEHYFRNCLVEKLIWIITIIIIPTIFLFYTFIFVCIIFQLFPLKPILLFLTILTSNILPESAPDPKFIHLANRFITLDCQSGTNIGVTPWHFIYM